VSTLMEGKMIEYNMLRDLVMKAIKLIREKPSNYPRLGFDNICKVIGLFILENNYFKSDDEYKQVGINIDDLRHDTRNVGENIRCMVRSILWDLVQERILIVENLDIFNYQLTEIGQHLIDKKVPPYYDPEGYVDLLTSEIPKLDMVIKEYIKEGLSCYRQHLFFAATVMLGAASERVLLTLLEVLSDAEKSNENNKTILDILKYSKIYKAIEFLDKRINELIKNEVVPFNIHEGCFAHIMSLSEMIRVRRNKAIHPKDRDSNRKKIFLMLQSFPTSLEVIYRLIDWFEKNKI